MKRRSRYALTKVSADLPAHIVQQLDGWKTEIEGINRSQLISDLLRWALEKDAVEALTLNVTTTTIIIMWMELIAVAS